MALRVQSNSIFKNHIDLFTLKVLKRLNTRPAQSQAVILERSIENPVIALREQDKVDLIGPPDPQSNLRPIIRQRLLRETALQQRLREFQDETQAWNQEFWAEHNMNFIRERKIYIKNHCKKDEDRQLTADEMSEFYKEFLDKNWETHVKYNLEWYKKNFTMLFLGIRCNLEHL